MDMRNLRKHKGQAIPIGMALLLFLGLTATVLFNTGQTATDKTRIVNTADSAVYSGLLWQARAMNFTAYTNRAMVANQVAMGQAVSLNSWSAYISKTGANLQAAFGWIPYVGAVTKVVDQIARVLDQILDPVTQGMMTVLNLLNKGIGFAQEGMYLMAFLATPDVVNSVVKSNDTRDQEFKWETAFSLGSTALNMYDWSNLTQNYDTDHAEAMNERYQIINASKDMFTNERNWRFFDSFLPVTPLTWFRFEKHGTTTFTQRNGRYEWYGKDAFSMRWKIYTWRGKKYRDAPIGGGSTFANNPGGSRMNGEPTFFGGRHHYAQHKRYVFHKARELTGYSGIQAYRSLHEDWRSHEDPPTLKLRIEITMDSDKVNDFYDDTENNRFAAKVDAPANILSTVATGELFFEKPCYEQGCETEFANGYSPFWDVRLARTTGIARMAAYALHAPNPLLNRGDYVLEKKIAALPNYNEKLATPITDYKAQAKGVRIALRGMENHLASLANNPAAYLEYEERLDGIRNNINGQVDDLIDDLVADVLPSEGEFVEAIASAAGYDLDVSEFGSIEDAMANFFPEINGVRLDHFQSFEQVENMLQSQVNGLVDDLVDEMEQQLRNEIEQLLEEAVMRILQNMVSGYLSQYGIDPSTVDAAGDVLTDALTDEVLSGVDTSRVRDDDITFDLTDECSIYDGVEGAESDGLALREKLDQMNQEIVAEFQVMFADETNFAVSEQGRLGGEIDAIDAEITEERNNPTMTPDEFETWEVGKRQEQSVLQGQLDDVPSDRVHELTLQLMDLTNTKIQETLPGEPYRLEYGYARGAVLDMLGGDIDNMEIDENGDPVTDGLLFSDEEDPTPSDNDEGTIDRPEGC